MVDLVKIRESKKAKYDITLKKLISLNNSKLRDILGLPKNGVLLMEQFPDWDEIRSDTLYYSCPDIYHVEFQTDNDANMAQRMFEYFARIQGHWKEVSGYPVVEIYQQVLFIGYKHLTMPSIYKRGRTTHEFDVKDLTSFYGAWFSKLMRSTNPEDWILASLTAKDLGEHYWRELAERIVAYIDQTDPPATDLPALLIIAAILRNVEPSFVREIEKMVRVNISSSRLLRQIYDEGSAEFALKTMLQTTTMGLEQRDFFMTREQAEFVAEFGLDEVCHLNFLAISGSLEEISNYITPPSRDNEHSASPFQRE